MNTNELNIRDIFLVLKTRLLLILLSMVFVGVLMWAYTTYLITPEYTASVSMYVYSNTEKTTDAITQSELTASKQLVDTYIVILESDTVLDSVIESLNLNCSANVLRGMMTAKAINETEAFSVSITSSNPETAQMIANAIADTAPSEIIRVVKAGGVEVIDYAKLPTVPSSPDIGRNTILGVFLGLFLSCSVVLLGALFDTTVRCEEDLTIAFNIPVIGTIPTLPETGSKKAKEA